MTDPNMRAVTIRDGRTVLIPQPWATDGYSVLMYNFAGPGWNSTQGAMAARPVETFDFAAKLHDLHYVISNIGFKTVGDHTEDVEAGRGSARDRSHQHKADRIFRLMVEHTGNWGIGPYYSRTRFSHERTEWAMEDDGFVNILTEPALISVLNEYQMMPWSELPRSDRHYREQPRFHHDHGHQPPRPDYAHPVPQDREWFQWAQRHYEAVWGQVLAVS